MSLNETLSWFATRRKVAPGPLPAQISVRGAAYPKWGWLISVLGAAALLISWQLIFDAKIWSPVFVPSPSSVIAQYFATTGNANGMVGYEGYSLWFHLGITLQRIAISSVIAIAIGVPLGLALGLSRILRSLLWPWVTFLRQLPPLAYLSLLVIWFGIDEAPKLILLVIAAVPPIVVSTAEGLAGINKDFVHAAQSLGASRFALVRTVLLPGALPEIFTGIRLGIGVAYTSVVAAETINGLPGLGGMIRDAQRYNITAVVILGILVLGLTGLILEFALAQVQRIVTPWRGRV